MQTPLSEQLVIAARRIEQVLILCPADHCEEEQVKDLEPLPYLLEKAAALLAPYEQPEVAWLLGRAEGLEQTGQPRWADDLRAWADCEGRRIEAEAKLARVEAEAKLARVEGVRDNLRRLATICSLGRPYLSGAADDLEAALAGAGGESEVMR